VESVKSGKSRQSSVVRKFLNRRNRVFLAEAERLKTDPNKKAALAMSGLFF
jgi:hypothetical protein